MLTFKNIEILIFKNKKYSPWKEFQTIVIF